MRHYSASLTLKDPKKPCTDRHQTW